MTVGYLFVSDSDFSSILCYNNIIIHKGGTLQFEMSRQETAVFIGHNECYGISLSDVEKAIIPLIEKGVTDFLSGGQGGFDWMCARCVKKIKQEYPQIRNILVIPYLTFSIFDEKCFDEIIYPDGFEKYYFKAAIPARNRYMVNNAAYAVCYVRHSWGGAAKTYEYAKHNLLQIINL